jgi:hypothetical protein
MKHGRILAAAIAIALPGAAQATHGPITVTFSGTITAASGAWILLGQRAQDYAGASFDARYVFDPAHGALSPGALMGGTEMGTISPGVSVTVTINGAALTLSGNGLGAINSGVDAVATSFYAIQRGTDASGLVFQVNNGFVAGGGQAFGSPSFADWDGALAGGSYNEGLISILDPNGDSANLTLSNTHLTISNAAAVPEPASWALMVAGFGLAGAARRRRNAVNVRFASPA